MTRIEYGRKLWKAGVSGAREGTEAALGHTTSGIFTDSAKNAATIAVAAASLSLLRLYVGQRKNRVSQTVAYGVVGSALGFCAGFGWKTRKVTARVAHSVSREIAKVRDEHWLEHHPIDYA